MLIKGSHRFFTGFMALLRWAFAGFFIYLSAATQAASLAVWPINPRLDAPASSTLI